MIISCQELPIAATHLCRTLEQALGITLQLPTLKEQMVEGYGDQISDPGSYRSMLNTNASLM
jgi:hypothetical protein